MGNEASSIRYPSVDARPKISDVFTAFIIENAKTIPALGGVIATIEKIQSEHEMEGMRIALSVLESKVGQLERHLNSPEAVSLTVSALKLASTDVRHSKIPHYMRSLLMIAPHVGNNNERFNKGLHVLESIGQLSDEDLVFLRHFSASSSRDVIELVYTPSINPVPDLVKVKSGLRQLWPTVMRIQGYGLLVVTPRSPMNRGGPILDVNEYTDFLQSQLVLSESGVDVVWSLGYLREETRVETSFTGGVETLGLGESP